MSNHPNRNANSAAARPLGAQIRTARLAADLTPKQAGALIYERASRWLAFEEDRATMHPASWELWQHKAAQNWPGAHEVELSDVVAWADGIRGALGTEYADRVTDREAIIADAIHRAATTPTLDRVAEPLSPQPGQQWRDRQPARPLVTIDRVEDGVVHASAPCLSVAISLKNWRLFYVEADV